jgi:2-polyprenyl-3-methyl-5-hydroxy-6-metoxy-1,4-benzoquinol methylase
VASGLSILLVGLGGTALILANAGPKPFGIPDAFWTWLIAASCITVGSLGVRTLRWVFLLRRAGIRLTITDSSIGYLAGLSLLFVPFLLGETALRGVVHRSRGNVPIRTTCVLVLWERYLDVVALAAIACIASRQPGGWTLLLLGVLVTAASQSVRGLILRLMVATVNLATSQVVGAPVPVDRTTLKRLTTHRTWLVALATSIAAWTLPGVALWGLAHSWNPEFSMRAGQYAYASSSLTGAFVLAPGGVLVVGESLLDFLKAHAGLPDVSATLTVLAIRVTTVGLATALGSLFLWVHLQSGRKSSARHFDEIAHAYDTQIPEWRRRALLSRKTLLMERVLRAYGAGLHGLDVGCGQGWYVARMRALGFDVQGMDDSPRQVEAARKNLNDPAVVTHGTMLQIPAPAASYDFVYCINVLHHLDSVAQQQAAFAELDRVLRAGGLMFVHEINTRNILFRFYMGYVFPALNCIDEGVERWLLPNRLETYTSAAVAEVHYFTFLPEFLPEIFVRLLGPLERFLEASPLRAYSAHYMAVLQKPLHPPGLSSTATPAPRSHALE